MKRKNVGSLILGIMYLFCLIVISKYSHVYSKFIYCIELTILCYFQWYINLTLFMYGQCHLQANFNVLMEPC